MTVQGNNIFRGSFTSDGNTRTLILPSEIDRFVITNRSIWGSGPADLIVKSEWNRGMAAGTAINTEETAVRALFAIASTVNGFTEIDFQNPPTYTPTAVTAVTQANPAQVTSAAHGLQVNDLILMTNITGMQQISSLPFEVLSIVDPANFTISIDTTAFAAPGTGGTVVKTFDDQFFRPQRRFITKVIQGAQTVIHHSIHIPGEEYVGEKYRFIVPPQFGMTELNGRIGEVVAINDTANTITIDIDSSGFTPFSWPASAAVPFTFAHYIPVGEISSTLTGAVQSRAFFGLQLGTDVVGSNTDIMDWTAFKGVAI